MARRSKEELLAEFQRLYTIFETLSKSLISAYPNEPWERIEDDTISRERMLEWLKAGKATPSQLVAGAEQGLNDLAEVVEDAMEDDPPTATTIMRRYKEISGNELFEDIPKPSKLVKKIVERGYILDDTEYYLLKNVVIDVETNVLSEKKLMIADALLEDYEMSKS